MTYKELITELQKLPEEYLDTEVLIYNRDTWTFHPACDALYMATVEKDDGIIVETTQPHLSI